MQIKRVSERTRWDGGYDQREITTSVYKICWWGKKLILQYINKSIPVYIIGYEYGGLKAAINGPTQIVAYKMDMKIIIDKR